MNKDIGALGVVGGIKKSVSVAEWLIAAIREGEYEVGDKLPLERALAEELGVSRTVVREALSSLQVAGFIEPRVGDGTYVVGRRSIPVLHLKRFGVGSLCLGASTIGAIATPHRRCYISYL